MDVLDCNLVSRATLYLLPFIIKFLESSLMFSLGYKAMTFKLFYSAKHGSFLWDGPQNQRECLVVPITVVP